MGQKEAVLRTAGTSLFSIPPGPLTSGQSPRPLEGPPPAEPRTATPHEEVHPHSVRTSYGNPAAPKRPCPPVLGSSWPSRGHCAQRVGPPWLELAQAQTWDLAMFPIV